MGMPLGSLTIVVVVGATVVVVVAAGMVVLVVVGDVVGLVDVGAAGVLVVDVGIVAYVVDGKEGSVTATASRSRDESLQDTSPSAASASTAARHCDMEAHYPRRRADRPTR
jgi:hypothetical protein